jgi:hypothetical protein
MVKIEINAKQSYNTAKPLLDKGYYVGRLKEVREFQDQEGNPIIGNFKETKTRKLIFDFEVLDKKTKEPVMFGEELAVLGYFVNYMYKKEDELEWRSALSPLSKLTEVFTALGWVFDAENKNIDSDNFIGKECEILLDDYEKTLQDGTTNTFSIIKSVNKLKGGNTPPTSKAEPKEKLVEANSDGDLVEQIDMTESETDSKIKALKKQLDEGLITQRGYEMAVTKLGLGLNDLPE